jgi:transcriptional regulator with XRE-family HTH domain
LSRTWRNSDAPAREHRGLSERELADAIHGISLAGIRAIEAGGCNLDLERMIRLARALGVGLSAIIVDAETQRE